MTYLGYNTEKWGPFRPGHRYEVIASFVDEQNTNHPIGETWEYLGYSFFPYDNGLTLHVKMQDQETAIRLELKDGLQKEINDNWPRYIREKATASLNLKSLLSLFKPRPSSK